MKKIIKRWTVIISIVLFLFIGGLFYVVNPIFGSNGEKPVIEVSKKRLYADVEFLTSIKPPRNYLNVNSLNRVADYIFQQFKKEGYEPGY